jgi:DNA-binding MarR family transcriptional regulator
LSRLLVVMQRKQLIVRRRSGLDGRALSLTLTQRGLELTEQIAPYAVHYEDVAMRGLSEPEVRQLKQLLKTVYLNLETEERETAERKSAERPRARKRVTRSSAPKRTKASA